jgi:Xaa-Pro aminopeptidase
MVWMDCCCRIAGYWSDFSRAAVIGSPSAEQVNAQEAIHRVTSDAVKMVRPGIPASSIARFCFSQLERLPFSTTSSIARRAERVGHGVGLNVTELPHISEYDDTPLEPGMVITLEPGVATEYGTFHVEENLVVTSEGSDVLSQAGRELCQLALAD